MNSYYLIFLVIFTDPQYRPCLILRILQLRGKYDPCPQFKFQWDRRTSNSTGSVKMINAVGGGMNTVGEFRVRTPHTDLASGKASWLKWIPVWELKDELTVTTLLSHNKLPLFILFGMFFILLLISVFFPPIPCLFFQPRNSSFKKKFHIFIYIWGFMHGWGSQPTSWLCPLGYKWLGVNVGQLSRSGTWMKEVDKLDTASG